MGYRSFTLILWEAFQKINNANFKIFNPLRYVTLEFSFDPPYLPHQEGENTYVKSKVMNKTIPFNSKSKIERLITIINICGSSRFWH